ncbi:hypothetical protein A2U01_0113957, partial [Trifolium medium]|nr:hypothetical protein [Trifolium medium]
MPKSFPMERAQSSEKYQVSYPVGGGTPSSDDTLSISSISQQKPWVGWSFTE